MYPTYKCAISASPRLISRIIRVGGCAISLSPHRTSADYNDYEWMDEWMDIYEWMDRYEWINEWMDG